MVDKLAGVVRSRGGEIRTGARVGGVRVSDDSVAGVWLDGGDELSAPLVLSSAGAQATMQLLGTRHFNAEDVRRLRNVRAKGTTAKINLALSAPVAFSGLPADRHAARLLVAPGVDYVERAFNPAKYGEISTQPVLEIVPDHGGRVLSVVFHYAPFHLHGGWDSAAESRLLTTTLDTLAAYAPGLPGTVSESEVLSPATIATLTGAPGGHWHSGEWSTDQILGNRPINGASFYRFGVSGLYLCGAAAHPGGDISGLAGRNAALQALADGGRR